MFFSQSHVLTITFDPLKAIGALTFGEFQMVLRIKSGCLPEQRLSADLCNGGVLCVF